MKRNFLKYLSLSLLAFVAFSCDDEDGFYNEKYVETAGLVHVITEPEYHSGEYLFVESNISRVIAEPGFTDPLDLYATTGGATAFTFSYILEKQSSGGEWEFVDLSDANLNIIDGSADAGSFVLANAEYDQTLMGYRYYGGIPLASAGNYRLSFGVNSDAANVVEFRSNSSGNNINLNLLSTITGLDQQGYF